MNYGEWSTREINRARDKAEHFIELYYEIWQEIRNINNNVYRRYVEDHISKFKKFSIFAPKALEEAKYFEKISSSSKTLKEKNLVVYCLYEHNSMYNMQIYNNELRLMDFFKYNVVSCSEYKNSVDLIKRLQYCTGGEIDIDDVYILCDIDISIKLFEEELSHYNKEKQAL